MSWVPLGLRLIPFSEGQTPSSNVINADQMICQMKFAGHEPVGAIFFLVLWVGLCLNPTSALSQQQSKEKRSKKMDEKMALAQKTLEANESKLRKIPGVVGVGLGW